MLQRLIEQLDNLILIASPARPSVDVLFLADANFRKGDLFGATVALATDTYKVPAADIHFVASWDEAVKIIQKFGAIKRLVMKFHGAGGSIEISDVEDWPAIDEVHFEGCELARRAEPTLRFTRNLRAKRLMAWNFYHVDSVHRIQPRTSLETIQAQLKAYASYNLRGTPDAATIKKEADALERIKNKEKQVRFVGREWLREDEVKAPLPKDAFDPAFVKYKKLSEAVANKAVISTDEEAEAFTNEQQAPMGLKPRLVVFEPAP